LIFNIFVVFDTTQGIGQSIFKASGQQGKGAIMTGFGYFGLGIPVTLLLVKHSDLGIVAIWLGPTLATAFLTIA
jgi:Na+-driven multidrug efflux pump